MLRILLISLCFCSLVDAKIAKLAQEYTNLTLWEDAFVLESKRIHIPLSQTCFNPSMIDDGNQIILIFRTCSIEPSTGIYSDCHLAMICLDESLNQITPPHYLDFSPWTNFENPEDPRIFRFQEELYITFNALTDRKKNHRTLFLAKLDHQFSIEWVRELKLPFAKQLIEKNWVPFTDENHIYLGYTLFPHIILSADPETGSCKMVTQSGNRRIKSLWPWGEIRGGTPALLLGDEYLALFHSSIGLKSQVSIKRKRHYFAGAYTFQANPPFQITRISPKPIVGKDFYTRKNVEKNVIFPSGIIQKGPYLYIAYGKDDNEVWIAKIDTERLIRSLVSVN